MFLKLCQLALAMAKAGTFSWGGAQALIPFMHADCVERYGWITDERFSEMISIDVALPGIFAIKLAAMIGWEVAGVAGLLVSCITLALPGTLLFMVFFKFVQHHRETPWVNSMLNGVQYGACGLIAFAVLKVLPSAQDRGNWRAFAMGLVLMAGVFVVLKYKLVSPAVAMFGSAILGVMLFL
jgi:chromate transporter